MRPKPPTRLGVPPVRPRRLTLTITPGRILDDQHASNDEPPDTRGPRRGDRVESIARRTERRAPLFVRTGRRTPATHRLSNTGRARFFERVVAQSEFEIPERRSTQKRSVFGELFASFSRLPKGAPRRPDPSYTLRPSVSPPDARPTPPPKTRPRFSTVTTHQNELISWLLSLELSFRIQYHGTSTSATILPSAATGPLPS